MNKELGVPCSSIVYYLLCELNGDWMFVVEAVSCSLNMISFFLCQLLPPFINM